MFSLNDLEEIVRYNDDIDSEFDDACRHLEEYVDDLPDACSVSTFIEFAQQSGGFDRDECVRMIRENTIVSDAQLYELVELIEHVYEKHAVQRLAGIVCSFVY